MHRGTPTCLLKPLSLCLSPAPSNLPLDPIPPSSPRRPLRRTTWMLARIPPGETVSCVVSRRVHSPLSRYPSLCFCSSTVRSSSSNIPAASPFRSSRGERVIYTRVLSSFRAIVARKPLVSARWEPSRHVSRLSPALRNHFYHFVSFRAPFRSFAHTIPSFLELTFSKRG